MLRKFWRWLIKPYVRWRSRRGMRELVRLSEEMGLYELEDRSYEQNNKQN